MNTWYVYEQVNCDQVHKHYITCKHILIKQGQSLKNDYNEHLASKCSSGHTMQLRPITRINCMSNTQPMQNTQSICIKDTRSYKGTSVRYLRHISNILKAQKNATKQ